MKPSLASTTFVRCVCSYFQPRTLTKSLRAALCIIQRSAIHDHQASNNANPIIPHFTEKLPGIKYNVCGLKHFLFLTSTFSKSDTNLHPEHPKSIKETIVTTLPGHIEHTAEAKK